MAHKFSAKERQRVINTGNDPRFADLPSVQIVALLSEEKQYIGSEITIYRIMREAGLLNHRGRAHQPRKSRDVPMLTATAIHQVLAWDITLLLGPVKDQFYYFYMVMDVWTRRILGVEVHEPECSELASDFLIVFAVMRESAKVQQRFCTPNNGAPMRSFTLAAKLAELGVTRSFSRPGLSNDNGFAESLLRTLKYHQSYLIRRFRSLYADRCWVDGFVEWYNAEHRYSGIKYVTPNQRHFGEADEIWATRQQTYEKAREENPRRWSRPPRCWKQPEVFKINHPSPEIAG